MQIDARRPPGRRYGELLLLSGLLVGACSGTRSAIAPANSGNTTPTDTSANCPVEVSTAEARALVDKYCVSCHSPTGSAGEDYDFRGNSAIVARRHSIEAKLRMHVMPPPSAPQPSDTERATLRCWANG